MKDIFVTRPSMPSYEEYCAEIKSIWDTLHLTNVGPLHEQLEEGMRDYLGVENAALFVNGHTALYCALKALDLQGEIITTPYTFASTTNAIVQAGCTPVFCDVKPDYTIDESKIESLITERTSAILGVHVYGNVCNIEAIDQIARRHGLKVVYDAAHTFGVEYKGRGIGTYGDAAMFSFHATKVFHTIEGGCLTFQDGALAEKLARLRDFGIRGPEALTCFGINAKMNEFQAAMGLCNLRHLDEELALRGQVCARYDRQLAGVPGITSLVIRRDVKQNHAYYPVLVDPQAYGRDRDTLFDALAAQNIFTRKYFYPLTSENQAFGEDLSYLTPAARHYSRNILCLPLYAHLSMEDVDKICDIVKE